MSENRYPSQKLDQYMLRLPDGMRDRIKAAAEANNRSMNAEIVAVLEEKYPSGISADVIEGFLLALVDQGAIDEEGALAIMRRVESGGKYQVEVDVDDDGVPVGPIRISNL